MTASGFEDRDLLTDSYRTRSTWQVFLPTTIVGYPAALQQSSPTSFSCTVTAAVADQQGLDITVDQFQDRPGGTTDGACRTATGFAAAVIDDLPPLR